MTWLRSLVLLLLALSAGILTAQWIHYQSSFDLGEVVIRLGGYDYSTSGPQAILVLIVTGVLAWSLYRLVMYPWRAWSKHKVTFGVSHLLKGYRDIELGDWSRAHHALHRACRQILLRPTALAAAFRLAVASQQPDRIQSLGQRLAQVDPPLSTVLMADYLLSCQRGTEALSLLENASAETKPPRWHLLRARALMQTQQLTQALAEFTSLRQNKTLPKSAFTPAETQCAVSYLNLVQDDAQLEQIWQRLTEDLRIHPSVVSALAYRARTMQSIHFVLIALEHALDHQWDQNVLTHYGRLLFRSLSLREDTFKEDTFKRWLDQQPNCLTLLVVLTRLHYRQGQLEQAKEYLHRVLKHSVRQLPWESLAHWCDDWQNSPGAATCLANALAVERGYPPIDIDRAMVVPADIAR